MVGLRSSKSCSVARPLPFQYDVEGGLDELSGLDDLPPEVEAIMELVCGENG